MSYKKEKTTNFMNPYNINDFYKVFGKCSNCSSCSCDKSDREDDESCSGCSGGCNKVCEKENKNKESGGICRHCGCEDPYPERGDDGKVCCWKCFDFLS